MVNENKDKETHAKACAKKRMQLVPGPIANAGQVSWRGGLYLGIYILYLYLCALTFFFVFAHWPNCWAYMRNHLCYNGTAPSCGLR